MSTKLATNAQSEHGLNRRIAKWPLRVALLVAILLTIAHASLKWTPHGNAVKQIDPVQGIELIGDARFVDQVQSALELLRTRAPDEYDTVQQYVKRIRHGERSGMWANQDPPTFELADRSAFHSVTWCAGAIAHDSYHSKLYHEYLKEHGDPVPYDAWGDKHEVECIEHQLGAMVKIGAPANEINHLRTSDGSHADVNRDGKTDWQDYSLRNW